MNGLGELVINEPEAIFDTGSSLIIGDPNGVQKFASKIGATSAPEIGDGFYTSTSSSSAGQQSHILIFVSQYLATLALPSTQEWRSQFLPAHLTLDLSLRVLTNASPV